MGSRVRTTTTRAYEYNNNFIKKAQVTYQEIIRVSLPEFVGMCPLHRPKFRRDPSPFYGCYFLEHVFPTLFHIRVRTLIVGL